MPTDPETLRAVNQSAAAFYTAEPNRAAASAYLRRRGIDTDVLPSTWTFGYAPPGWTHLAENLRRQFSEQALLDAGVARVCSRGTLIDTFRDRVLFPIHDQDGAIAGFIGRDLSGHALAPKYLNTHHNALFDKGRLLYGLHEGFRFGEVQPVVVEGPLDVLAIAAKAEAHGHRDLLPVAPCGTSFTAEHARAIAHFSYHEGTDVMVAMDGDPAGRAAALRAGERLREQGLDVRVAMLPNGTDPADYLASSGHVDAFRPAHGLSLIQLHVTGAIAKLGDRMQWIEIRVAVLRSIARYLATYPSDVTAGHVGSLADALDLQPSTVTMELVEAHVSHREMSAQRAVIVRGVESAPSI